MPLPTPSDGESRDDFMARCMGDETMREEYPEQDQRTAVCARQWEGEREEKSLGSGLEVKSFESFEIKDAERGEVVAIVATLGVVDRDGDVILPGAIPNGAKVKLSAYAHDVILEGASPVGKGIMSEEGDKAVFRGNYFMTTDRGQQAFYTAKELGPESEWSFGFPKEVKTAKLSDEWRAKGARRVIAGLLPIEASPCLVGAGIGTGTVGVKQAVKEAVKEVEQEARKAEEEAEAAKRVEEEAAAIAKKAEEDAIVAEAARIEAERKAQEEVEAAAEVKRLADEAEAQRQKEEIAQKQRVAEAMEEYHRVQRALKRMGFR